MDNSEELEVRLRASESTQPKRRDFYDELFQVHLTMYLENTRSAWKRVEGEEELILDKEEKKARLSAVLRTLLTRHALPSTTYALKERDDRVYLEMRFNGVSWVPNENKLPERAKRAYDEYIEARAQRHITSSLPESEEAASQKPVSLSLLQGREE
ncbi:hypothetical protein HYZ97_02285 [Candidatus Pacearchaeota archaeon]|nr:hypothetical protein [Candidatus Pacearchaeota archaeon]